MKSFVAGLALGLAGVAVYEKRSRRRRQGRQAGRSRRSEFRPDAKSVGPKPARVSLQEPAGAAEVPENRSEAGGSSIRRNAEEVLNSATRQQLLSVYGIGPVLADRIIQNRPYAAAYDVVEQGIIPQSIFVQLRKQLLEPGA